MNELEFWVERYHGFIYVSNLGNIRRVVQTKPGLQQLRQVVKDGELTVRIVYYNPELEGRSRRFRSERRVSEVVYWAFNPKEDEPPKYTIEHKDGDPMNCRLDNLYLRETVVMCTRCGENPGEVSSFGLCEECASA